MSRNGKGKKEKSAEAPPKPPAIEAVTLSQFVETLASLGLEPEDIALLMPNGPADVEAIKRDYAIELERGPAKTNLEAVQQLATQLRKGNMKAVAMWLTVKMGWQVEKTRNAAQKDPPEMEAPPSQVKMPDAKEMGKILHIQPRSSRR